MLSIKYRFQKRLAHILSLRWWPFCNLVIGSTISTRDRLRKHKIPSCLNYDMAEEPYSHTQHLRLMLQAVDAVISGQMSQREAAKAFNIPRSTLRCHLPRHETYKHKVQKQPSNSRGKAIFSKKEEKELVDYLVNMHRCGFGRTRRDFMLKLQETLNKAERKTKFENNMPSDEWFAAFLERHKDSIKECIIHYGTQEKGLIPADVFGVSQQVIEEAVQSVVTTAEAPASTVTIHQPQQQQQQHLHHQQPQHIEISGGVSPTTYHQLTVPQQPHQHPALQGHTVQGFGPFATDNPGLSVCLHYSS
ncbi:Jerky protein [Plakobranchus ocellatus]|uniref:Jerky protein n=1 Tax=Plakobranchus ocellatus TaxID=259542 RepID=A0AAV4AXM2_9GAST|nr:Jerky protein [Plakobranchus ocellatus]